MRYLSQLSKPVRFILAVIAVAITYLFGLQPDQLPAVLGDLRDIQPGYYQVVEFNDGDTISVRMDGKTERVRFIGVDTPEKNHPKKPVQCFAEAASSFTKQLIGNNTVRLEADPTNDNRDRYDRLLRYVYLPDQTLVNGKIIEAGYGFAYTSFPFTKMDEFRNLEAEARQENRGLWQACQLEQNKYGNYSTNPVN